MKSHRYTETSPKDPKTPCVVPAYDGERPVLQQHQKNCPGNAEYQQKHIQFLHGTSQVKNSLRMYLDVYLAFFSVRVLRFRYLEMYDVIDLLLSSLIPNIRHFRYLPILDLMEYIGSLRNARKRFRCLRNLSGLSVCQHDVLEL